MANYFQWALELLGAITTFVGVVGGIKMKLAATRLSHEDKERLEHNEYRKDELERLRFSREQNEKDFKRKQDALDYQDQEIKNLRDALKISEDDRRAAEEDAVYRWRVAAEYKRLLIEAGIKIPTIE